METSRNRRVYSVKQINEYARMLLSGDPLLGDVSVRGEISNLKYHSSGHIYFSIKDSEALLRCAFFRQNAMRSAVRLEDGMQVVAHGYVTVYPRDGTYQLVVSDAAPDGVGALYALFEKRKAQLAAQGLFDPAHKKALPVFARRIAVITSPTGAVLHDIVRVSRRRYPGMEFLLLPVAVQGDGAAEQIAQALDTASALQDVDAVIVGRGGGSMEDLWAFNDETLVRAVAASRIPVISAVGHETDFTLCDFAADHRAPTPSAAAELAVPDRHALMELLDEFGERLDARMEQFLERRRSTVQDFSRRLGICSPEASLARIRQTVVNDRTRMDRAMQTRLEHGRLLLSKHVEKLGAVNPLAVLERGFGIVSKDEKILSSVSGLREGDRVDLRLSDGRAEAEIVSVSFGE